MKKFAFVVAALVMAPVLAKDVYVKPHVRKDGTYVEGHYRTAPDSSRYDNYSTQGNVNPYTGQQGTVSPYPAPTYPAPGSNRGQSGYCPYGQRCD